MALDKIHKPKIETTAYWEEQIKFGLDWRKLTSREDSWSRYKEYYEHNYGNTLDPHFNLIYMMGSVLIPSLVFQNPHITNTARRPEFQQWAQYFDGIDNWCVDEMELSQSLDDMVLSCFLQNTALLEFGYDYPTEEVKMLSEMTFPPKPGIDRTRKYNQPWVEAVDGEKFVLARGTTSSRNCPWYARFHHMPVHVLKDLDGVNKKNVEVTHVPEEINGIHGNEYMSEREGYQGLWVIHDAYSKKWGWMSTAGKWVLPLQEDPLQVDGLPMEIVSFNKGIRSAWGTPDVSYIETQHIEGDESRRDGRLQRREALVKAFYDSNILEEEDIRRFLTSEAMGCIPVDVPGDKNIQDCIYMVQGNVQMQLMEYDKQRLNDAQLIVGHGPNQLGTFAPGRRTAKETGIVEEQSFLRLSARRAKISNAVGKIFGRINQIIVKEWKAPMISKVVGIEGAVHWVQATPSEFKDVQAQLVTKVNVESLAPTSRERRKQEMVEVLSVVAKLASSMEGQVNLLPIIQNFLSQFDWVDITQVLPQAQQAGPESMDQFAQQQQQQQQNPQALASQLQNNLGGVNNLIGKLPVTQQGAENE